MTATDLILDPKTTALVLIDLQKGIAGRTTAPHSAQAVIANCAAMADAFRTRGAAVVLVHVAFSQDQADRLMPVSDLPQTMPAVIPPEWSEFVPEIGPRKGDIVVAKRQWGAFYGTDLDLQLRRRGILTIVLGGIATNMGVESTGRSAFEHGYQQIYVEDGMASFSAEMHAFAIANIFPRIGRVRSTDEVLRAMNA